jgi:predicted MPP superfamily phosphohydrolase
METTTMQKLIKELDQELKKYTLGGNQYYGLLHAKRLAETMLDDEKQQFLDFLEWIEVADIKYPFNNWKIVEQYYKEPIKPKHNENTNRHYN